MECSVDKTLLLKRVAMAFMTSLLLGKAFSTRIHPRTVFCILIRPCMCGIIDIAIF